MTRPRIFIVTAFVGVLLLVSTQSAKAVAIIMAEEIGGDVVLTHSGSLNLSAWTIYQTDGGWASFYAAVNGNIVNGAVGHADGYLDPINFIKPASFGTGVGIPTSSSGDQLGIEATFLRVPTGYVSGESLSGGSSTYASATFLSLGMTPGTYVWSWGSNETADSMTLNIARTSVPDGGATIAMLGLSVAGLAVARRRKG